MSQDRCGNFCIEVEEIYVTGAPVVLRIPIRRCLLAERMIAAISETEEGREVASKLRIEVQQAAIRSDPAPESITEDGQPIRAAFGPDLEAISSAECTRQRCRESCTPGYKMLLLQFGHRDLVDREPETGCAEESVSTPS